MTRGASSLVEWSFHPAESVEAKEKAEKRIRSISKGGGYVGRRK
jgi:hypothetical protein